MMSQKYLLLYLVAVSVLLLVTGCGLDDPTEGVKTEDVISLSLEKDNGRTEKDDDETEELYADGVDYITLVAKLGEGSDPNKKVEFRTDSGRFAGIPEDQTDKQTYSINASGKEATAILVSGVEVVKKVTISAWVGDFADIETVEFIPALPNELLIESDKPKIKADNSDKATITVELFRDSGKVSNNTRVVFTASAPSGVEVDIPQWAGSNANERVVAEVRGKAENNAIVRVTAMVGRDGGEELSKSIEIELEGTNPQPPAEEQDNVSLP